MHQLLAKTATANNQIMNKKRFYNKPKWLANLKIASAPLPGYTDIHPSTRTIYFNNNIKDTVGNVVGVLDVGPGAELWSYGTHPTTGMGYLTSITGIHTGGVRLINPIIPTDSQNYSFVMNFKIDSWSYRHSHLCGGVGGYPSIYSGYGIPLTFSISGFFYNIDPAPYMADINGWFQIGIHRNATQSYITINGKIAGEASPGVRGTDTFILGDILNYQLDAPYTIIGSVGTIRYSTTCYTTAQLNQMMMQDLGLVPLL